MISALIGKKLSMSVRFNQTGERIPVTALRVGPCVVTQVRTDEKDGYWAVQLGYGEKKLNRINKPLRGFFKKAGLKKYPHFLCEVPLAPHQPRVDLPDELKVGSVIKVSDIFQPGDVVKVAGRSKGRGFAGVMKRWGFAGGPRTHGQSDRKRAPGSIGQTTDPGRVWPGKKMAGHLGNKTVVVKNLVVQDVLADDNLLWVKGAVPGSRNALVLITKIGHDPNFKPGLNADESKEAKGESSWK